MKGKIDRDGRLLLARPNTLNNMSCPKKFEACWDKCALFGEPGRDEKTGWTWLTLCHKSLSFDEFTDERE